MDSKQIAKTIGVSEKHVEFILTRKRRPSPEVAVSLEKLLGVDRRAWLWPDEYSNPLISIKQEYNPGNPMNKIPFEILIDTREQNNNGASCNGNINQAQDRK